MKFKKSKLLISLLSIGGLSAVLVPTITLTSCSSTVNPTLSKFTSNNSSLEYIQLDNTTSQVEKVSFTISNNNPEISIGNSSNFTSTSFAEQWKKLKETINTLPDSISSINTEIDNFDVLSLVKQQNSLNIFNDTINNLKNVYENFISTFFRKSWDIIPSIINSESLTQTNKSFFKFLANGINASKFYAYLYLDNINIDVSIDKMPTKIGIQGTETPQSFLAKVSNVQLNFSWYQINFNNNNLIKIEKLDDLKSKAKEINTYSIEDLNNLELTYNFNNLASSEVVFNMLQNKTSDNKYYETGLIRSSSEKPLIFQFVNLTNDQQQNQNKTDWFNKEVLNLSKEKVVTDDHLKKLFAKIGYLTKNDLPENNSFPTGFDSNDNIKLGKEWVNSFIGINLFNVN